MKRWMAFLILWLPCAASTISLTGGLNPNDANDVLLFSFTLSAPATLTIQSYGYGGSSSAPGGTNAAGQSIAAGGFDTYVSLFTGSGSGATFLASNDDGVCPPGNPSPACHDSTLVMPGLAANTYTLALSVFDNFSFAENFGSGTLGDGFIGLGDYFDSASGLTRTSNYALDVSASSLVVAPEPSSFFMCAALAALCIKRKQVRVGPNAAGNGFQHNHIGLPRLSEAVKNWNKPLRDPRGSENASRFGEFSRAATVTERSPVEGRSI